MFGRFFSLSLVALVGGFIACDAIAEITLRSVGTFHTGLYDKSAAEIPTYCQKTKQVFVVNAESGRVDVLGLGDDGSLKKVGSIDAAGDLGNGMSAVNSVSVLDGTLAVAVEAGVITENGRVAFYDTGSLQLRGSVEAGALPDMVTFTPNGHWVLVANEGEPNEEYTIDPEGTVTVVDVRNGFDQPNTRTVTFRDWNLDGKHAKQLPELKKRGLRIFGQVSQSGDFEKKTPATFAQDVEPEWIAVDHESRFAYVCLQEVNAVAEIEIAKAAVCRIIPLGYKDFGESKNGIDASDKDDRIDIRPRSGLFGILQPDTVRIYQQNGKRLLVTANEGDSRVRPTSDDAVPGIEEGAIFEDEASLEDWPTTGTQFEKQTADTELGRLKLVRDLVDDHLDEKGRPTQLFAFGSRSFSIIDLTTGDIVFDSDNDFEQITAQHYPEFFNVSNDSLKKEKRSRSKGPEPEGLVLGTIGQKTYAFVGLERIGGIMVYDITQPESSRYVGYFNNRRFEVPATLGDGTANPEAGDSGIEGLIFVPAEKSPTSTDLVIVGNETSGTTTVWEVIPNQ
ncbi:MAG: alkaline phosphatase [Planctomycetaceae bacterium]|nr:alkaline phosphatase [Planctomycetaceae bacterium]MBT6459275.1 alkaline phosphatase [Planctomycetaceae bacterium]